MRKLLAALVAALCIGGPIALTAGPSSASITNGEDLGVVLEVAQATANPTGPTEIVWQETATVRQGYATLLRAQVSNAGLVPSLGGSVTIQTGGRVDTASNALSSGCSVDGSGATDVVTCSFGLLLPGGTSGYFTVPVATPSVTTLNHSASVPNELLGLPIGVEAPDTDTATTIVTADSGYGLVNEGESLNFNNGSVNTTFTAPVGSLGGGSAFVNLYQGNGSDSTCGATTCAAVEARADWVQVSGSSAPTAGNPLLISVSYPGVQQTCNGSAYHAGCNPLYFQATGTTVGTAEFIPPCTTFSPQPGGGDPIASADPCVYGVNRAANGAVTHLVAILTDSGFPIPLLGR